MPPHAADTTGVLYEDDVELDDGGLDRDVSLMKQARPRPKVEYVWLNIILFPIAHSVALYACWLALTSAHIYTTLFTYGLYWFTMMGLLAGVHRLWSHKAFKASRALEWFLVAGATMAYQNDVIHWVREHRVHHKFSETDADPVNAARGFFFSHVGWLMVRKHPDVAAKGRIVDMSDLEQNPVLAFNKKYYVPLTIVIAGVLPLVVPVWGWNETWLNSFCLAVTLRWVCSLNAIFLINSAAHKFGPKPYDKNIQPAQNVTVSFLTGGGGFHNYHHSFPWDYKASEHGFLNLTKSFIDACAWLGLAWDLKSVGDEMIKKRAQRTGDGSHEVWGWGDPDQTLEDRKMTTRTYQDAKRVQ